MKPGAVPCLLWPMERTVQRTAEEGWTGSEGEGRIEKGTVTDVSANRPSRHRWGSHAFSFPSSRFLLFSFLFLDTPGMDPMSQTTAGIFEFCFFPVQVCRSNWPTPRTYQQGLSLVYPKPG